jgi:hypothetical protein
MFRYPLILCVVLLSCQQTNSPNNSSGSIQIEDLEPFSVHSVDFEKIKKLGFFQKENIDVLAYEKQISETKTLIFYVDDLSKEVFEETWRISMPEFTEKCVEGFVEENNGIIITGLCIKPNSTFVDFFVENISGIYFRCRLEKASTGIFLEVDRRYPSYYGVSER